MATVAAQEPDPEHVILLEASIEVLGLHTPITVARLQANGEPDKTATFKVVAGGARLAACERADARAVLYSNSSDPESILKPGESDVH